MPDRTTNAPDQAAGPTRRQCLLGAALAPLAATAQGSEPRIALVIGNADYPTAPLTNPVNDAKAMTAQLTALGFAVIELRNAKAEDMRAAVATLRYRLAGRQGTGLFYYAGHGLQLDWRNYLLPLDANPRSADEVRRLCLDMQEVFNALRDARTRVNVVVLDACRENPFSASASGRGLAPLDAPLGTYIAYSTAPGHLADDEGPAQAGNSGHGLFTGFLLEQLRQPVARIEDVFKRVRFQVQSASAGRQVPWDSSSLVDDFYFGRPGPVVAAPALDEEKQAWDRLAAAGRIEEITAYLVRYPNGRFTEQAQFRLEQLQGGRIVAQLGQGEVAPPPPGRLRYARGDRLQYRCAVGLTRPTIVAMDLECDSSSDLNAAWNNVGLGTDQLGTVTRFHAESFGPMLPPEVIGGPVELSLGKRWRSVSFLSAGLVWGSAGWKVATAELEHHAVARERITVGAGTFDAFRVEAQGRRVADKTDSLLRRTFWIDPATMTVLRIDAIDRPAVAHNPNPHLPFDPTSLEHVQRFELVGMQRVAR